MADSNTTDQDKGGALRSGGQLLMDCLVALGARKGFGVPGESYLSVLDAMVDHGNSFDLVSCRQEGGAAYMAAAWGKLTGEPGLCFVTRGPGATNAAVGIHTAMQDSLPMLVFIGQVGTNFIGREAFQEVDYTAFFGPLAKWAVQIDHADRVPEIISRAWSVARSGRPGPVVIALPEDMLTTMTAAPVCRPVVIPEPSPSGQNITDMVAMLEQAKTPLVIVGGSCWPDQAARQIEAFCTANDVPVVAAHRFHDIIDNDCPVYGGDAGVGMSGYMIDILQAADVIVAINIRFGEMTTNAYTLFDSPNMAAKLVHAHPSDAELGKIYAPDLPIHAGASAMAAALSGVTLAPNATRAEWCKSARANYLAGLTPPAQPGALDMGQVTAHIQAHMDDDAIITHGAGNFALWPNKFMRFGRDARMLGPQSGSMGFGVPAAIMAKAFDPDRMVICFAGDGDFQMNHNELGTALQAGLFPIILILNNGTYGTIRMHQEREYPARVSGTDIVNPDFVKLAEAYGFHGERVSETSQFADAFARACASTSGAILELMIDPDGISPRATITGLRARKKA